MYWLFSLSLLSFLSAAFAQAESYCVKDGFKDASAACVAKQIDCAQLDAHAGKDDLAAFSQTFGSGGEFEKQAISNQHTGSDTEQRVSMGNFAEIHKRGQKAFSEGYATCSSAILLNPSCESATLSHFIKVPPQNLFAPLKQNLKGVKSCAGKDSSTEVVLFLSSRTDKTSWTNVLAKDGYYYQRLICQAAKEFPGAKITVIHSTKDMSREHDNISIGIDASGSFQLSFDRISSAKNLLIQSEKRELKSQMKAAPKSKELEDLPATLTNQAE